MRLDTAGPWHLYLADETSPSGFLPPSVLARRMAEPGRCLGPADFAAAELASAFLASTGRPLLPADGTEADDAGIIILDTGAGNANGLGRKRNFAWRASPRRVEIHGGSASGLVAGAWDFLDAAGFSWPSALGTAVVPDGREGLALSRASAVRRDDFPRPVLILGHGSYLERGPEYFLWAARNGYSGVFVHTTPEALAFGAAPAALYESLRNELVPLAGRLGLSVELGGHGLSGLLPRSLFRKEPGLFRMTGGKRIGDRNFCPSNPRSLELVGQGFVDFVEAHPEVEVFHVWPDDLPGGGWCSCPDCAPLPPAAQSLKVATFLATLLEEARPDARLSFLAYHDTESADEAVGADPRRATASTRIPRTLELLWAPRMRSWARGYGDPSSALNAVSAARLDTACRAFARLGADRFSVFEYWEDAILFKAAVPPLPSVMESDLSAYSGRPGLARVGILLTGDRLPLAPRPNAWLFPRLLRATAEAGSGLPPSPGASADALMERWCAATYGGAAAPMGRYWKALEAAWAIDLDLEPGDTGNHIPDPMTDAVDRPPADWGDPWKAGAERLAARRARCEELFDRLREAEDCLAEAASAEGATEAVRSERAEYAIASGILEANCARLSAYHELANGSPKAAADLALIARSILDGVYKAQRASPDRRARRNGRFLLFFHMELRLRAMARGEGRGLIPRAGKLETFAELALRAARLSRAWERRTKPQSVMK